MINTTLNNIDPNNIDPNNASPRNTDPSPQKPPTTRAAINRANAQHSTGPRTAAGKAISRLNALRHTLCSQTVVSTRANLRAYERYRKRWFQDLQPKGIIEVQLVQTLADCGWRLNCARAYEANLLTVGSQEPAAHVKLETDDPEVEFALTTAKAYSVQEKALSSMSRHEARVSREFHQALTTIRAIQAERREQERQEMIEAARLYKLHQEMRQVAQRAVAGGTSEPTTPYDATKDGFVLATEEIETYISRQERKAAALEAESRRSGQQKPLLVRCKT